MEFIESSIFTKYVYDYLTENEYYGFQNYLLQHPKAGNVVPRSGGVRKIRWSTPGSGKRGGVRIIYFYKMKESEIWLLTIYRKSEVDNIPAHQLKEIAKEIRNE